MELSRLVGAAALALGAVLATGHALAAERAQAAAPWKTAQNKVEEREAQRRAAVAEHQRRKDDFARRCNKPVLSAAELEACRVAYRQL